MDYFTRPYILELNVGHKTIYIGGNSKKEIEQKNRWPRASRRWLRSACITKVNTWTRYKLFGLLGDNDVLYIEESSDGRINKAIDTLIADQCNVYVFEYI